MTVSEIATTEQAEAPAKAKRTTTLTAEQKKASQLRRDASMCLRMAEGSSDPRHMQEHAEKLLAEADKLAPAAPKAEPRPDCAHVDDEGNRCGAKAVKGGVLCFGHTDPMSKLSETEWTAVEGWLIQDIRKNLLEGFSWRALKDIAKANPSA